jgi:hypothetical protein
MQLKRTKSYDLESPGSSLRCLHLLMNYYLIIFGKKLLKFDAGYIIPYNKALKI